MTWAFEFESRDTIGASHFKKSQRFAIAVITEREEGDKMPSSGRYCFSLLLKTIPGFCLCTSW